MELDFNWIYHLLLCTCKSSPNTSRAKSEKQKEELETLEERVSFVYSLTGPKRMEKTSTWNWIRGWGGYGGRGAVLKICVIHTWNILVFGDCIIGNSKMINLDLVSDALC